MSKIFKTIGLLFGLFILFMISSIIVFIFTDPLPIGFEEKYILQLDLSKCIVLAILYIHYRKEKNIAKELKFNKIRAQDVFYIILFGIVLTTVVSIIREPILGLTQISMEVSSETESNLTLILGIVSMIIIAPIIEEIVFRGIIFNHLKRNYSILSAIIVQAMIFAVAHGNISQGLSAFLLGIILVLAYMCYNSIFASIILHIIFNLLGGVGLQELFGITGAVYNMYVGASIVIFICLSFKMISNYKKYRTKSNI